MKFVGGAMQDQNWRERIECNPRLHGGEPCIKGTRVRVAVVVASLADMSVEELLNDYPQLTKDDVKAALWFAAEASHNTLVA